MAKLDQAHERGDANVFEQCSDNRSGGFTPIELNQGFLEEQCPEVDERKRDASDWHRPMQDLTRELDSFVDDFEFPHGRGVSCGGGERGLFDERALVSSRKRNLSAFHALALGADKNIGVADAEPTRQKAPSPTRALVDENSDDDLFEDDSEEQRKEAKRWKLDEEAASREEVKKAAILHPIGDSPARTEKVPRELVPTQYACSAFAKQLQEGSPFIPRAEVVKHFVSPTSNKNLICYKRCTALGNFSTDPSKGPENGIAARVENGLELTEREQRREAHSIADRNGLAEQHVLLHNR
jgi:hypothetical protein